MSKKKKRIRAAGTHGPDEQAYRKLSYRQRVASFNMTCNLLVKYVKVQVDEDCSRHPHKEIIKKRKETLQKAIDSIERL